LTDDGHVPPSVYASVVSQVVRNAVREFDESTAFS
jgi:hypothetical protein